MFLRSVKTMHQGITREYLRLVESYREGGKVKQRLVCTLGRKDVLAPHLPALARILRGDHGEDSLPAEAGVQAIGAWDWGPVLVASRLFKDLGLWPILDACRPARGPRRARFADHVFALIANRLCCPSSEHGLARWFETDFVCDRAGNRWLPQWRERAAVPEGIPSRVRVEHAQLNGWYRTLDLLIECKPEIERKLFENLRSLFSLKVDFVFYDITSTYFEGRGCPELAKHGHSRDGKPRDRQVVVGLVMIDGWPVAHHIWAGNRRDSTTVEEVIGDVQKRFGIERMIFVGDRGMVTTKNVQILRDAHQGYLVGLNRRRSDRIYKYIESAKGPWLECPVAASAAERKPAKTLVQEVASQEPDVRVFVVQSEERLEYERGQREASMEKVRQKLEALKKRVSTGKLKAPEKIGACAARILARNHGDRYFTWQVIGDAFDYGDHPVNLVREKAYEGKYVIQTEETSLSPIDAVRRYKELSDVERGFARLKDVIEMRPIFHKSAKRVQAHIFVAALALLVDRALEKKLKAAGLDFSSREAWQALQSIRVVEIDLGAGKTKRSVTRGSARVEPMLRAVGIHDLDPPAHRNGVNPPP